jgi:hypothetical protein
MWQIQDGIRNDGLVNRLEYHVCVILMKVAALSAESSAIQTCRDDECLQCNIDVGSTEGLYLFISLCAQMSFCLPCSNRAR